MLKYWKSTVGSVVWVNIPYEEALMLVLCDFKDCDRTRDMLTIPNFIYGELVTIKVADIDAPLISLEKRKPEIWRNRVPDGVKYDENGMRLK